MALNKPKIVILGAGYGGLMTVTRLTKYVGEMMLTLRL